MLDPEIESSGSLQGRAQFGLAELEGLLGGGLTRGTSTVIIGSPGTGKTLLSLQWALEGIRRGEPAVIVSMREDRAQLLHKADMFALGAHLREALAPVGGSCCRRGPPSSSTRMSSPHASCGLSSAPAPGVSS